MPMFKFDFIDGLWIVTIRNRNGRSGTGESWLISFALVKAWMEYYDAKR